jgi:molecular chaperone DnaJ
VDIELTFAESIFGVERKILLNKTSTCDHCKGSGGEPGTEMKTCPTCNGNGHIRETRRSILGTFTNERVCDSCHGTGKVPKEKCHVCKGAGIYRKQSEISVKIPAGINPGEMVRLTGGGEAITGGNPGDLYIRIHIKAHPTFHKEGNNLVMDLHVKLSDALLGAEYRIDTLDGPVTLSVPQGVAIGEILRLKGKGVPINQKHRGDLLVHIKIDLPRKLSKESKKLIEELKKEGI